MEVLPVIMIDSEIVINDVLILFELSDSGSFHSVELSYAFEIQIFPGETLNSILKVVKIQT